MEDLTYVERLLDIFERQSSMNEKVATWMDAADRLDDLRAADIQELREGLAALSNRVEALTRMVADGGGLHSVKVPQ